jgi:hypothetical protein
MSATTATPARAVQRIRAWVALRSRDELALGLPLLLALVYLARLGGTFQERLTVVGGSSDAIHPLFIAATMDEVPDADVHMGNFGHYIVLWYARATEWLPFDREIWQVIPPALWIASVGIVVWAAWRTVGARVAVLTGVLGFCVSPFLLFVVFSSTYHPWTIYSPAIALGLVVLLATQARTGRRTWVVSGAAALALGAAVASDPLVLLGTIGPLLIAGVGVAIRHPTGQARTVGVVASIVAVAALPIAAVITKIMEASGFITEASGEGWIEAHLFFRQIGGFLEESLWMLNGYFFGRELTFESALTFAVALGVMVALVAPFIVLWRLLREPQPAASPAELGRSAYIFFWAATMAIVPLGAVASDQNVSDGGARYVLPVLFAAAATVPLLARSVTARYLVIAGVSVYALLGILTMDMRGQEVPGVDRTGDLQTSADRVAIHANELIAIADREQAQIGYAGYWEAGGPSWSTKFKVNVFPVNHFCENGDGVPCPVRFNMHGGWYVPRPGIRSFLVSPSPQEASSYEPPPALGPPLSTHDLSDGTQLYVYPYDIAERFPQS